MVLIAPCSLNSRTRPVKLTTAPISRSRAVSASISAAISKSSVWTETEERPLMSATGDRREEGDFRRARNWRVEVHHLLIHRHAHRIQLLKRGLMAVAACGKLPHQFARGLSRSLDLLLRNADPVTHPRKIQHTHHTLPRRRRISAPFEK